MWNLFHLFQTGSQNFCRVVRYEFFKHVFHRSILSLLWRLPEVTVQVPVNRLNYHSCTKRGVYTVTGVIPVWLPLLWLFQIAKWKFLSVFPLSLDFSKRVINFLFTHTELPKSSYSMIVIYYNTVTKRVQTKLEWLQEMLYVFWILKKTADLRITWQKSSLSSFKRLNVMDCNLYVAESLAHCGLLLSFSRACEILIKDNLYKEDVKQRRRSQELEGKYHLDPYCFPIII